MSLLSETFWILCSEHVEQADEWLLSTSVFYYVFVFA